MSKPTKIATLTKGAPLGDGGILVYAIEYRRNGDVVGRGYARGDELDVWRNDLTADGWTVEIKEG